MTKTYFVASVAAYRKLAKTLVTKEDTVLEIGCAAGDTTKILCKGAGQVVAVDLGANKVAETREKCKEFSNLTVKEFDARGIALLKEGNKEFSVIFSDIGGDAEIGRVAALLYELKLNFKEAKHIIIRSIPLAGSLGDVEFVEEINKDQKRRYFSERSDLKLFYKYASSPDKNDRLFAARLLMDIKPPKDEKIGDFLNTIERLKNDSSVKIRYYARKFAH